MVHPLARSVPLLVLVLVSCAACGAEQGPSKSASAPNSAAVEVAPAAGPSPYGLVAPALSAEDVDAAVAQIPSLSSFLILKDGTLQREFYANGSSRDRPINIKSASKSVLNALTGIALARGELKTLDAPISDYLTEYYRQIPAGDPRRQITIRHLVTMSSGLPSTSIRNYGAWVSSPDWVRYALSRPVDNLPGTFMTYSTGDSHVLAAILTRATGTSLRTYAQRHLFDPLDVEIGGWDRDPQGIYFGGNNMALSPRGLLNFGRLYLDGGEFDGRQVLPREWIAESWQPRFLNSSFNLRHDYGYLWWHTRFASRSVWFAWGYGGQFLFVVPELDAVVVLTCDPDTRTRGNNNLIYGIMETVIVPWLAQGTS